MALLWATKFVKFGEVKGFEMVGCVGRSVEAVSGARTSARVSLLILLGREPARTLESNVGVWILVGGRNDSILDTVIIIFGIDLVAVFIHEWRVAVNDGSSHAGVVYGLRQRWSIKVTTTKARETNLFIPTRSFAWY